MLMYTVERVSLQVSTLEEQENEERERNELRQRFSGSDSDARRE